MVEITDQQVEKWLESFLKVIKEKYQPEKVLIFGSRARGDHFLESDVDMIIVSPKFEGINWIKRINEVADLWEGMVLLEPLC
jgi:uncharacterized protein